MTMGIYIALLALLLAAAMGGQIAYTRALARSGVRVPVFVKVLRFVNLALLVGTLVGAAVYLLVRS